MHIRKQEFDAAWSKKSFANRPKAQCQKPAIVEPLESRTLLTGTLLSATNSFSYTFGPDAADPVRDVAYVVDQTDHKLLAINTDWGITVAAASLASSASAMCVSLDDTRLFVAEPGAFQIEVFSLPSLKLLKTLNVGVGVNQLVALANDRIAGDTGSITIFNAETGASLYSVPEDYDGLIRGNAAGTQLYDRARGLSGNDGSINVWDVSGTGAPASLPNIPGPTGANSSEFIVDESEGKAWMGDGGIGGMTVTDIASGQTTTWTGGAAEGITKLQGSPYVYELAWSGSVLEQFDLNGNILNTCVFPQGYGPPSLIITPNGHLMYTFINNIGIIGISTLNVTLTAPQLLFHYVPSQAYDGNIIAPSVVVDIVNSNNQVVTQDNSNVTLSLLGGTLAGTTTVTAVNGVATFSNIVINSTGTYAFYAADSTYNPTVSSNITVSRAQLTFASSPSNGTAGQGLAPGTSIDIDDASGHVISTDNSAVTISAIVGPGTLAGILTVNAVHGVANIGTLAIYNAGTYRLYVSDGADNPTVSAQFTINPAAASRLVFAGPPANGKAGTALNPSPVVYETDAFGNLIRSDSSTVTLTVQTGPGAIFGTSKVALSNGAAVFNNIWFDSPGAYTLHAEDGSLSSPVSSSFQIATAYQLVFASGPTKAVAGKALSPPVVMYLMDYLGNIIRNNTSTVTLSVASGPGGISGSASAALNNGAAIFSNISFTKAGSYQIRAAGSNFASVTSNSFAISAATASKIAFTTLPSGPTHGSPFTVNVSVEDAYGNVVSSQNSGTVTLALVSHPTSGVLGGTLTANFVNGIATFNNLSVNLAGTYSIKASDAIGILSVTSSAFVAI